MTAQRTTLPTNVRLATMDELRNNILPNILSPVPSVDTLRDWFAEAGVRCFKRQPLAKRGGGTVYYWMADVEKLFSRTLPCGKGAQWM